MVGAQLYVAMQARALRRTRIGPAEPAPGQLGRGPGAPPAPLEARFSYGPDDRDDPLSLIAGEAAILRVGVKNNHPEDLLATGVNFVVPRGFELEPWDEDKNRPLDFGSVASPAGPDRYWHLRGMPLVGQGWSNVTVFKVTPSEKGLWPIRLKLQVPGFAGYEKKANIFVHEPEKRQVSDSEAGGLRNVLRERRKADKREPRETVGQPPALPKDNPVPTDLKTEARTLVRKERERRGAMSGGSPLDPTLVEDLRYEYSTLREIAAFGANAPPAKHQDVANDARTSRLRVEKRLRDAGFGAGARFVFTSYGEHLPLPDAQGSPLVRSLMAGLVGASNAQRETQRLIGDRLDRLQALIEALQEPEGES